MNEPTQLRAGDTLTWTETLSDYPPSGGWNLFYTLVNAAHVYSMTAATSGEDYVVALKASDTQAWVAGVYKLTGYVSRMAMPGPTEEVHTVYDSTVGILPNLTTSGGVVHATAYDGRSHARKMLDALEAVQLGRASKEQLSYQIGSRSLALLTPAQIRVEWEKWNRKVQREEGTYTGKILPRFNPIT